MSERILDAVDALTKPTTEYIRQELDDGTLIGRHKIVTPPLLHQLRDAVHPSGNSTAGSASLKSNRNVIDSTALYEYSKISAAVNDWCRGTGATPDRDPAIALRRWAARYDGDGTFEIREMWRWVNLIRRHLDPPRQRELKSGCPICGATTWTRGDEGGRWPLILEYRAGDGDSLVVEQVICRACDPVTTWIGEDAVMELLDELDEKVSA